jgi:hypothetical protein
VNTPVYLYSAGRRRHISTGRYAPAAGRREFALCGGFMNTDAEMVYLEHASTPSPEWDAAIVRNRSLPVCGTCQRIWDNRQVTS